MVDFFIEVCKEVQEKILQDVQDECLLVQRQKDTEITNRELLRDVYATMLGVFCTRLQCDIFSVKIVIYLLAIFNYISQTIINKLGVPIQP